MRSRKTCHHSPEETYSVRIPRVWPLNDTGFKTTKVGTIPLVMRVEHIALRNMLRMRESKEDARRCLAATPDQCHLTRYIRHAIGHKVPLESGSAALRVLVPIPGERTFRWYLTCKPQVVVSAGV